MSEVRHLKLNLVFLDQKRSKFLSGAGGAGKFWYWKCQKVDIFAFVDKNLMSINENVKTSTYKFNIFVFRPQKGRNFIAALKNHGSENVRKMTYWHYHGKN